MFITFLNSVLCHTGVVQTPVLNAFGKVTTVTTVTTTSMYAFQDDEERYIQNNALVKTHTFDWLVLLPSSLSNAVTIGCEVANIVDVSGRTVLSSGIISNMTRYEHWDQGLQCILVSLSRK